MDRSTICCIQILAFLLAGCGSQWEKKAPVYPDNQLEIPGGDAQRTPEEWFIDRNEMRRTWQAASVLLPMGNGEFINTTTRQLKDLKLENDERIPVVVYLHGCSGFWKGSWFRMEWLAKQGFAVIAPNSLARIFYPPSCIPATFQSGLYRQTILMRQYDAGFAIEQLRQLPWVSGDDIILMGFSEGAAVSATLDNRNQPNLRLKGRILESWGCHTGWSEYEGINAPPEEPVLALVADRDSWYNNQWQIGNCGDYLIPNSGSISHVVKDGALQFEHGLLENENIQAIVLEFIQSLLMDNPGSNQSGQTLSTKNK